jgi:hypothetical protein
LLSQFSISNVFGFHGTWTSVSICPQAGDTGKWHGLVVVIVVHLINLSLTSSNNANNMCADHCMDTDTPNQTRHDESDSQDKTAFNISQDNPIQSVANMNQHTRMIAPTATPMW